MLTILGMLTGLAGPLAQIGAQIVSLEQAKTKAASDEEKQKIDAELSEAHDRKAALIAEAGSRLNAIIRGGLAFGPFVYLLKVFLWDKVIGSFLGHACFQGKCSVFLTDQLDVNLWKVVAAVIAFYFLYDMTARWRS